MFPFIKGAASSFVQFCSVNIPIRSGWSIPVYVFLAAGLGIAIAFKFIRGLFG